MFARFTSNFKKYYKATFEAPFIDRSKPFCCSLIGYLNFKLSHATDTLSTTTETRYRQLFSVQIFAFRSEKSTALEQFNLSIAIFIISIRIFCFVWTILTSRIPCLRSLPHSPHRPLQSPPVHGVQVLQRGATRVYLHFLFFPKSIDYLKLLFL